MPNQTGGQQENALARPPTEELLDQLERHGWAVLYDLAPSRAAGPTSITW